MDDPFIGAEPFLNIEKPPALSVELVRHGGHLGYLSRTPWMGTRRWLDSRLTTWLSRHWAGKLPTTKRVTQAGVERAAISAGCDA